MLKVCIHNRPYVTRSGYEAIRWRRFYIYVGIDPEGPRGGRGGLCVNAKCMFGPYRNYSDAMTMAKVYSVENGYELI